MSSRLEAVLRRLPALSHLLILLLAIYGPSYSPVVLATVLLGIHIVLGTNNLFLVWGQFCAWRGVEATCSPNSYKSNDVEHIIIIPAYKEDLDVLRETLDVLTSHANTKDQYRVCLAMEDREVGSGQKAIQLEMEYQEVFAGVHHSLHPVTSGEAPGKSSNVNWAARFMSAKFDASEHARQVITIIDSDTCLSQDYFQMVGESFAAASAVTRSRMMFCIPILFDRNAHEVPVFVRLTDILWAQAGFSTTYPTSDIKIPTSAYGISMELANHVGFWDTGPEALGEDMHMFVKCFLSTGGNLHVETIYSPASQLNVVGSRHEEGGVVGWLSDMRARYAQGMRHVTQIIFMSLIYKMWGSLDSGYAVRRILTGDLGVGPVNWLAVFNLLFRLFQAHIMLGWLFILLIGEKFYPLDAVSKNGRNATVMRSFAWEASRVAFCIRTVAILRGFSVVAVIASMLIYDMYHYAGAVKRWNKPESGARPRSISLRRFPWSLLDLSAILGGILFGIVPLFHAQFLHLFTSTLTYHVSLKTRTPIKVSLVRHRRKDSSLPK